MGGSELIGAEVAKDLGDLVYFVGINKSFARMMLEDGAPCFQRPSRVSAYMVGRSNAPPPIGLVNGVR